MLMKLFLVLGRLEQPRQDQYHLYSLSHHLPQFQQSAGATLSSLSGMYCNAKNLQFKWDTKMSNVVKNIKRWEAYFFMEFSVHDVSENPAYIPKYKRKNTWFSYRLNLNVTIDGFVGENVLPGKCCPSVQPKHFKFSHSLKPNVLNCLRMEVTHHISPGRRAKICSDWTDICSPD